MAFRFLSEKNPDMWDKHHFLWGFNSKPFSWFPAYIISEKKNVEASSNRMDSVHCPSLPCWWPDLACDSTMEQLTSLQCYLLTPHLQPPPFIRINHWLVSWVLDTPSLSSGYTQEYVRLKFILRKRGKITKILCCFLV